jgi:NAD(P)-dependent dehydrogenase (short-subunit alcohol dehydrogenase family)
MELSGRTALVTGGGTGIGAAVALALAAEGCRVAVTGRSEAALRKTAETPGLPAPLAWQACDVADRAAVDRLFRWVAEALGPLDMLVNSAGMNVLKRTAADVDPADFDRVMAVNLGGTFNCVHAALPGMRARRSGLVVNIVSVAGRRVMELAGLPYTASKYAQAALGRFVGFEAAKDGIRVTNIYPGETDTPILEKRPVPVPPERRAAMLKPEDVAACVLLVAKLPPRAVVPELVITPPYMMQG